MTFKEFDAWCYERACDGCWSRGTSLFCLDVIKNVKKQPVWCRERCWQAINGLMDIENMVVNHINDKIEAHGKDGT